MIRTLLSTLTAAVLAAVLAVAPLPGHTMQASPAAAPPARPASPRSGWRLDSGTQERVPAVVLEPGQQLTLVGGRRRLVDPGVDGTPGRRPPVLVVTICSP
jgi:hypothetical protein